MTPQVMKNCISERCNTRLSTNGKARGSNKCARCCRLEREARMKRRSGVEVK